MESIKKLTWKFVKLQIYEAAKTMDFVFSRDFQQNIEIILVLRPVFLRQNQIAKQIVISIEIAQKLVSVFSVKVVKQW